MLDVSDIYDESYSLAMLGLQQGGAGLCHPVFVASIISSVTELQIAFPDIKDILADGQCSLSTVQAPHTTVQQLSEFDKQISVKSLLRIQAAQIPNLRHILYRKVREEKKVKFIK